MAEWGGGKESTPSLFPSFSSLPSPEAVGQMLEVLLGADIWGWVLGDSAPARVLSGMCVNRKAVCCLAPWGAPLSQCICLDYSKGDISVV